MKADCNYYPCGAPLEAAEGYWRPGLCANASAPLLLARMLRRTTSDRALHAHVAQALHEALAGHGVEAGIEDDVGVVGGGSRPGHTLPTSTVVVAHPRLDDVAHALRTGDPSVVARIADNALRLDVRTVTAEQIPELARRVAEALHVSAPRASGGTSADE